jgi:hypothetical protein
VSCFATGWRLALIAPVFAMVALPACRSDETGSPRPSEPLTPPTRLCRGDAMFESCRGASEVEEWLAHPHLVIVGAAATPGGVQDARVLTLRVPTIPAIVFRAKWRAETTATRRNSPRRELAAYAVQKLFLKEHEYVVPPTAPHCFALDEYREKVDARARASYRNTNCVYGILSYWLEDVQPLGAARKAGWFRGARGHALDRKLFESNRTYRDSIASVNLFTYLIAHADSHAANFLITRDRDEPFVYSIDNSLSLGMPRNAKLPEADDWSRLRVPALPRAQVDRIGALGSRIDELRSCAELEPQDGQLVIASRSSRASAPPTDGMDWVDGRLRVGLTASEIAGLRGRIERLSRSAERGQLELY